MTRRALPDKAGFALPLVLGMVTVLALIFLVRLGALRSLREETTDAVASIEFERAAMTAEARFAFLALSQPFGPQGLRIQGTRAPNGTSTIGGGYLDYVTVLRMDERPYLWRETPEASAVYQVRVQDEAGLLNLYPADPGQVSRLFQAAGLSEDSSDQLASEILEYNQRFAPAEPMRRLAELYSLPSGRDLITDSAWRRISQLAVSYPESTAVNINTAPREVLKAWFDFDDNQVEQAIKTREEPGYGVFTPGEIGAVVANVNINYAYPGGRMRFSFTDPASGRTWRSTLILSPNSLERPFFIENARALQQDPPAETEDGLEDFPEIPAGAA